MLDLCKDVILLGAGLQENLMMCAAPWVTLDDVKVLAVAVGLVTDPSAMKKVIHHVSERQMALMEVVRVLLSDPHVLAMNLSTLGQDYVDDRCYLVLFIWVRTGGLRGLLSELHAILDKSRGKPEASLVWQLSDRVYQLKGAGGKKHSGDMDTDELRCTQSEKFNVLPKWEARSLILVPADDTALMNKELIHSSEGIDFRLCLAKGGAGGDGHPAQRAGGDESPSRQLPRCPSWDSWASGGVQSVELTAVDYAASDIYAKHGMIRM